MHIPTRSWRKRCFRLNIGTHTRDPRVACFVNIMTNQFYTLSSMAIAYNVYKTIYIYIWIPRGSYLGGWYSPLFNMLKMTQNTLTRL
jgi:hypothetical protein